jgi:hypothetical protein
LFRGHGVLEEEILGRGKQQKVWDREINEIICPFTSHCSPQASIHEFSNSIVVI